MTDSASYGDTGSASGTHVLFGQAMGYVAASAGFFALGAYLARDVSYAWTWVGFMAALACLIAMNFAQQSASASAGLLFAFGLDHGAGDFRGPDHVRFPAAAALNRHRLRAADGRLDLP